MFSSKSQGTRIPGSCPWHQPAARSLCPRGPQDGGEECAVAASPRPTMPSVPPGSTLSPRPTTSQNYPHPKAQTYCQDRSYPQCQLCPQGQPHPEASHVPSANHVPRVVHVPEADHVPRAAHCHGFFHWGFPAQHGSFGPLQLCMGGGAARGTLGSLLCPARVPQRPAWTPNPCQKLTRRGPSWSKLWRPEMERWEVLIRASHTASPPSPPARRVSPKGAARHTGGATIPQPQEQPGQGAGHPGALPARCKLAPDRGGAEPGSS